MTLAELIAAHLAGRADEDLADACGHQIPAKRWRQMQTLPIAADWRPDRKLTEVIAEVLGGVTSSEVADAICASQTASRT